MYEHAWICINNFLEIWIIEILYAAQLCKWWCGKVNCKELLNMIHTKFNLHFYEFSMNLCKFWNFEWFFLEIIKRMKLKRLNAMVGRLQPTTSAQLIMRSIAPGRLNGWGGLNRSAQPSCHAARPAHGAARRACEWWSPWMESVRRPVAVEATRHGGAGS
jgi:hypothetical protein